ncbi:MAG TPA: hypothetical protein DC058_23025 [Planctomycetaceae bacterium]|nr:hypothetical protein [Planctomycetaceae bacterium]HBC64075.1 hypothetical protein [Planctomycetaceae bacterium]
MARENPGIPILNRKSAVEFVPAAAEYGYCGPVSACHHLRPQHWRVVPDIMGRLSAGQREQT